MPQAAFSAAGEISRPAGGRAIDPVDLTDHILDALLGRLATAVWFEPIGERRHRLTFEDGAAPIGTLEVSGGVGDAVLARLALLAGLELSPRQSQAHALLVRQSGRDAELVVTARATSRGAAGEVRLLERPTPVEAGSVEVTDQAETFGPGTRVGAYLVVGSLGRGGRGVVYEVEHTALRRRFAMKVLAGEVLAHDPLSARRFVREARAAARIRHPAIVGVTDFGTLPDGRPYLVMDLLHGRTLFHLRAECGALEPAHALRLVRQIAEALAAAHARGVVHRDLTPANVFLTPDGEGERVVLVDFGSATTPDRDDGEVPDAPAGQVIGTPHYMAPEYILGGPTDGRTDLYCLGVILHELLSGAVPYDGPVSRDIVIAHCRAPIPPLASPFGPLPHQFGALVGHMLAKHPDDRVQTAGELIRGIDQCLAVLERGDRRRRHS